MNTPPSPQAPTAATAPLTPAIDILVVGLGPGGCAAALAARAEGLVTMAVEARGVEATRSQLVLVQPGAQTALRRLGRPDITEGRRTTTIRHVETQLRGDLVDAAAAAGASPAFELRWHTRVVALAVAAGGVRVTLRDEAAGSEWMVDARHVIDASGGRLEPLGRPERSQTGPRHLVMTAEYATPPWFDDIVGVADPATHELYLLFPTWGRRGVIAYLDAPPGRRADGASLERRFAAIAERLAMGSPLHAAEAVDVAQRALARPAVDRVVAIGDSVGTVDVLLGAGMSTAIEDGVDAACSIAAAQRAGYAERELALTRQLGRRIFTRHRSGARRGRLILALRPLLERAWPKAALAGIGRDTVGHPPLLWPAVRLVFGRRPRPAS